MKLKLFYLTCVIFWLAYVLTSCAAPATNESNSTTATGTDPPVVIVEPPQPTPPEDATPDTPRPEVLFTVKISDTLYFSNHTEMYIAETGVINRTAQREFSVNSDLIQYDSTGLELSRNTLPVIPNAIKTTDDGVFYCKEFTPAESFAIGGMARYHSQYFKDDAIISAWFNNQNRCNRILSGSSAGTTEVFATDENNSFIRLQGFYDNILHIQDQEFIMHSRDTINKRINFNDSIESYITNHIANATNWQEFNGLYYSENGFTWSEAMGLTEDATELWDFTTSPYPVEPALPNGEIPVLLAAGVDSTYIWIIECNSGWVFKYDPAFDTLTQQWRIYTGDGLRDTGMLKAELLSPLLVDNKLYFRNDGVLYSLGLGDGLINIFYAGDAVAGEF